MHALVVKSKSTRNVRRFITPLYQRLKKMEPKLAANYQHFTRVTPHDTKVVHARAIPYGSYNEDTAALGLALIGLALMIATTLSLLLAFKVL